MGKGRLAKDGIKPVDKGLKPFMNFRINLLINCVNIDELVKSRHTREGGYPETVQLPEKTGFPIKDPRLRISRAGFGNDGLKRTFYETVNINFTLITRYKLHI